MNRKNAKAEIRLLSIDDLCSKVPAKGGEGK
jgi:hypothetical protein